MELPGWFRGYREGQQEAIDAILEGFRHAPVVMLDAATGAGKTIIAESSRQLLAGAPGRRTTYLCNTKSLQDQFSTDFPYAKVLKGRSNYPVADPGHASLTAEDCTAERGASCSNCPQDTEEDELHCNWCHPMSECHYRRAKLEAMLAPLSCTNIAYFLSESNSVGKMSKRDLIIIDEADRLEAELMSHVEIYISVRQRDRLKLRPPTFKTKPESWQDWLVSEAIPNVKRAISALPRTSSDPRKVKQRRSLERLSQQLKRVDLTDGWVYTGYRHGDIRFKPIRVDEYAQELLWSHGKNFLLMSATLISPQEMAGSLGIPDWQYIAIPCTFPVEHRPIVIRPRADMSHKVKDWAASVRECQRIIDDHPDERVLIHAVSYALAEHIASSLDGRPVFTYTKADTRDQALTEFRATNRAVLVAPSLDRGIDLPYDACRVVIVAKLPFPDLGDKQVAARLYGKGGQDWYATQTVRSLVQMTGRGMRAPDDRCTSYVIDKAFVPFWRRNRHLIPGWWEEAIDWSGGMGR